MISVVILAFQNSRYLLRCINSIKRQTIEDFEIIVAANSNDKVIEDQHIKWLCGLEDISLVVKKATEMASGNYLFFCSETSILAENVLEELFHISQKQKGVCPFSVIYTSDGADYSENLLGNVTLYAKLFQRSVLWEALEKVDFHNTFWEIDILLHGINTECIEVKVKSAIVYEQNSSILVDCKKGEAKGDDWKSVLFRASTYPNVISHYITQGIGSQIIYLNFNTFEVMLYAQEILSNDIPLNLMLAKDNIVKMWSIVSNKIDEICYSLLKQYFTKADSQVYLPVLLSTCHIDEKLFQFFMDNSNETFLLVCQQMRLVTGKFDEKAYQLRTQVLQEPLKGVELAAYVIDRFEKGELGLMTIARSWLAWIKYKTGNRSKVNENVSV